MSLFFNVPQQNTGDVPLNKPTLSVYDTGEPISMAFESSLGAGTESFAGDDAQLVAVQLENESSMQRFTDGFSVTEVRDLLRNDSRPSPSRYSTTRQVSGPSIRTAG